MVKSSLFTSWFNRLVVASDHKGQYHYAITVGNEIRTTLTPMTFSKPLFNGIQWDFATDKYEATLLLSRISDPDSFELAGEAREVSDNTNLFATRVEAQIGDFVTVGGHIVNAHHSNSRSEAFSGDMFNGNLLGVQNAGPVNSIQVLIKDDSPEDGVSGGALFASDITIVDLEGDETRGSEIGFRALTEGGFLRRGFLSADGSEVIRLVFDFSHVTYTGPDPSRIKKARIELVVADDYLIEISSDRQTRFNGDPAFVEVARARGNVKDGSNQRVVAIDYGLPTANQISGFTVELTDLAGFRGYSEFNVNRQVTKYPNIRRRQHRASREQVSAWVFNLSNTSGPCFAFIEAFRVSPRYRTSLMTVSESGAIDYANRLNLYEFVDDNDDQDRRPDWARKGWTRGDQRIFPGWDENNDFISDFNQNDNDVIPNRVPDYAEPFLRFHTDHPDFLYGVDMNHNLTIDRFENDEEADLPYKRDRVGYNAYGGAQINPEVRFTLGQERFRQISDQRRTLATYLTVQADWYATGRIRLFQDLRKAKDTIVDDLLQWVQLPNTRGDLVPVADILPAQNTWINTTWVGYERILARGLKLDNKAKWSFYRQLDSEPDLILRNTRRRASFLGLINKAEYDLRAGGVSIRPAFKNEYRRQTPVSRLLPKRLEMSQLAMALGRVPLTLRSSVEGGVEYHRFAQLLDPTPPGAEDSFGELVLALQLVNLSQYLGYELTTIAGLQFSRRSFAARDTEKHTRGFLTVFAGVQP